MTNTSIVRIYPLLLALLCSAFPAVAADVNLAGGTSIKASSTFGNSKAAAGADGVVPDESRCLAAAGDAAAPAPACPAAKCIRSIRLMRIITPRAGGITARAGASVWRI